MATTVEVKSKKEKEVVEATTSKAKKNKKQVEKGAKVEVEEIGGEEGNDALAGDASGEMFTFNTIN